MQFFAIVKRHDSLTSKDFLAVDTKNVIDVDKSDILQNHINKTIEEFNKKGIDFVGIAGKKRAEANYHVSIHVRNNVPTLFNLDAFEIKDNDNVKFAK